MHAPSTGSLLTHGGQLSTPVVHPSSARGHAAIRQVLDRRCHCCRIDVMRLGCCGIFRLKLVRAGMVFLSFLSASREQCRRVVPRPSAITVYSWRHFGEKMQEGTLVGRTGPGLRASVAGRGAERAPSGTQGAAPVHLVASGSAQLVHQAVQHAIPLGLVLHHRLQPRPHTLPELPY